MTIDGLTRLLSDAAAWTDDLTRGRAAYLGCGDSLAAARPAEDLGHRVLSAGDVAWAERPPQGVDVSIALSWSGRTGATIRAAEIVKASGRPVWAITSDPASPLASLADRHLHIPIAAREELIPTWGFALHSVAVLGSLGVQVDLAKIADASGRLVPSLRAAKMPSAAPAAITIASLPDARAAAEFWSLKLIEATGVAVRMVPLEEIGHVDYFIGPQSHLVLLPILGSGRERAHRLGAALERNGNTVLTVDLAHLAPTLDAQEFALALALAGGTLAYDAALAWGRSPFRGGVVDMSAQHIQVPSNSPAPSNDAVPSQH